MLDIVSTIIIKKNATNHTDNETKIVEAEIVEDNMDKMTIKKEKRKELKLKNDQEGNETKKEEA